MRYQQAYQLLYIQTKRTGSNTRNQKKDRNKTTAQGVAIFSLPVKFHMFFPLVK